MFSNILKSVSVLSNANEGCCRVVMKTEWDNAYKTFVEWHWGSAQ